jgi:hypothetical protein
LSYFFFFFCIYFQIIACIYIYIYIYIKIKKLARATRLDDFTRFQIFNQCPQKWTRPHVCHNAISFFFSFLFSRFVKAPKSYDCQFATSPFFYFSFFIFLIFPCYFECPKNDWWGSSSDQFIMGFTIGEHVQRAQGICRLRKGSILGLMHEGGRSSDKGNKSSSFHISTDHFYNLDLILHHLIITLFKFFK